MEINDMPPMSIENLLACVKEDPYDPSLNKLFNNCYELVKDKEEDVFGEIRAKLNYLHNPGNYKCLNDFGEYYLKNGKDTLSLFCYVESLRINPTQTHVFHLVESIWNVTKPVFSGRLDREECVVSVIMGTYKPRATIRESIQSVLNQSIKDIELIIINDGGDDNEIARSIAKLNSPKVKYHELAVNSGHATVINEGIRRAKGKYITYLDDDDIYYPTHLETLLNAMEKNESRIAYANTLISKTLYSISQIFGRQRED